MNARDIAETQADAVLRDIPNLANVTPQQIAAAAFMRGWSYGLRDAQRIHEEVRRESKAPPFPIEWLPMRADER